MKSSYRLLHAHGWKYDHLDIHLIQTIQEILAGSHPEINHWVSDLLLKYHAVEDHNIDLIGIGKYCWNPLEQSYTDLLSDETGNRNASFKAIWPQSDFVFVSRADQDLMLSLVQRAPVHEDGAKVSISVNGNQIATAPLSQQFDRFNAGISRENLLHGANKLSISWPVLPGTCPKPSVIAERLLLGLETSFIPTFGEIYSIVFSKIG